MVKHDFNTEYLVFIIGMTEREARFVVRDKANCLEKSNSLLVALVFSTGQIKLTFLSDGEWLVFLEVFLIDCLTAATYNKKFVVKFKQKLLMNDEIYRAV